MNQLSGFYCSELKQGASLFFFLAAFPGRCELSQRKLSWSFPTDISKLGNLSVQLIIAFPGLTPAKHFKWLLNLKSLSGSREVNQVQLLWQLCAGIFRVLFDLFSGYL